MERRFTKDEVLTLLTEDLLLLLLDDLTRPMMRVDHVVADLEIDALRLAGDLERVTGGAAAHRQPLAHTRAQARDLLLQSLVAAVGRLVTGPPGTIVVR